LAISIVRIFECFYILEKRFENNTIKSSMERKMIKPNLHLILSALIVAFLFSAHTSATEPQAIQAPAFDCLDDPNICCAALTPQQLVPYILNRDFGPDGCRLAGEWFVWKTRDLPEKEKLRNELAGKIVEQIDIIINDPNKSVHDVYYWAQLLGPLGAREQIIELLKIEQQFSCHYGPYLVISLGRCGKIDDVPFLIDCIDMESEASDAVVNKALKMLTGIEMPLKDNKTDKQAWQKWWNEYNNL
jgi:hypothetical protein